MLPQKTVSLNFILDIIFKKLELNFSKSQFPFSRALSLVPEFKFKFIDRDPSCLPKELVAGPGETCYFLDGFKHSSVDSSKDIQVHINAAIQQFNSESKI